MYARIVTRTGNEIKSGDLHGNPDDVKRVVEGSMASTELIPLVFPLDNGDDFLLIRGVDIEYVEFKDIPKGRMLEDREPDTPSDHPSGL
jgi:hypothetical protein